MYDFTVLVLDRAFPASVSVTLDVLHAASALAPRCGIALPRWRLCSLDGGTVALQRGMTVMTTRLPKSAKDRSIWIIPALGMESLSTLHKRIQEPDLLTSAKRIAQHVKAGGRVAASCSAVFVLQLAGVLKHRKVTTAWWLAPHLATLEPSCRVQADRMVSTDGPVITAGAALAQTDLMLHLLRIHSGNALAELVGRMLLIEQRPAQAPFIIPAMLASGSPLISQLTAKIEAALPKVPKVGELALELCMSERTLSRHVMKVTGKSPLALIQSIRLQHARALLEQSRMPVERVAEAVGYTDATALRRLIRKLTGATPSACR